MNISNKKRLLKLLDILKRKSDYSNRLSITELIRELEKEGVEVNNRKTLYDDFKALGECGYEVEYDNGYYLSDAPFSLSEIKILSDSVASLKNLDERLKDTLSDKLYSFISESEEKELKMLHYSSRSVGSYFINRLEDALQAIKNREFLMIKRGNREEMIAPLFLHRENDYYYLYYHYRNSEKIYHTRFDNILDAKLSDEKDETDIKAEVILDMIAQSTNSFYGSKSKTVTLLFDPSDTYLLNRIQDDFADAIITKKGASLKVSISDLFFSKISSYGTLVRIRESSIAASYLEFLDRIRNSYLPENDPEEEISTPR